ncbi:hypothetical protein PVAG01_08636 [Phlyctema vagabunda]|uniref:Uncharacterized protein n=1 Tax=Phlyctema vagabunda TaxID=108571 RepID=A0ABR4P9Z1_9HELO
MDGFDSVSLTVQVQFLWLCSALCHNPNQPPRAAEEKSGKHPIRHATYSVEHRDGEESAQPPSSALKHHYTSAWDFRQPDTRAEVSSTAAAINLSGFLQFQGERRHG